MRYWVGQGANQQESVTIEPAGFVFPLEKTHQGSWSQPQGEADILCTKTLSLFNSLMAESFPCGSAGKESACNVGDLGSIPGSLGWEDLLEKGKATHSSVLAWRTPWTVYVQGYKVSDTTEQLSL